PALYRGLALAGAEVMTIPAAFTRPTGEAHWEVLMRARAIETGSFVLAPAQGGRHEDGRGTWGHSIAVAPWGEVIGRLDHDEPAPAQAMMMEAMGRLRRHVEDTFDDVGDSFASEARAIHEGRSEDRGIYGQATSREVRDLVEDGVPIAPMPPEPPKKTDLN